MHGNPLRTANLQRIGATPFAALLFLALAALPAKGQEQRTAYVRVSIPPVMEVQQEPPTTLEDGTFRIGVRVSSNTPFQVLVRNASETSVLVRDENGAYIPLAPGRSVRVYVGVPGRDRTAPVHVRGPADGWEVDVTVDPLG